MEEDIASQCNAGRWFVIQLALGMAFRATKFEFEQRFWMIGVIFSAGFWLYAIDKTNMAVAILRAIKPSD